MAEALVAAATEDRVQEVAALLRSGVDPNTPNAAGRLALCRAGIRGNVAIVKMLLEAKAEVNAMEITGRTAIMGTLLVDARADVNEQDNDGWSALYWHISWGYEASVTSLEMLVRAGAYVDLKTKEGATPMQRAISNSAKMPAEYLLYAGAKVSNLKTDMVLPGWFQLLVEKLEHCRNSCRVLYGVLRKRWMLSDGSRVPRDMINLLTRLVWESRRDQRWQRSATASTQGPVHSQQWVGDHSHLTRPEARSPRTKSFIEMTEALVCAASECCVHDVVALLASGVDPNTRNAAGMLALSRSAFFGRVDCVKALLDAQAEVNALGPGGLTAVMNAAFSPECEGALQCMTMLLDAGADVGLKDESGRAALHWAAELDERLARAKMLVRAGAVVDVKTDDGWTPLQGAINYNAVECAALLLDAGAKVSNLKSARVPAWFAAMVEGRELCRATCSVLYGVLRKRWMVDGHRVPRDMINVLTRLVWDSRRDARWLSVSEPAAKVIKASEPATAEKKKACACCKKCGE